MSGWRGRLGHPRPVPLVMQLGQRHGDTFSTEYAQRSLERWRILIRNAG